MTVEEILNKVQMQELTVSEAKAYIQGMESRDGFGGNQINGDTSGYKELGFAKLDMDRKERTGFGEVVYCEGKTNSQLIDIYNHIYKKEGEVLGTRASAGQYDALKKVLPEVAYDPVSRILKIEREKKRIGKVVVCCAGTADIPVAEEAAVTAEFFGTNVVRIFDIGVCGIGRLLSKVDEMKDANCIVAVAGMEGALASVLGGLVSSPIIAVPTSVGYGANLNGLSALLTMINSCANGVAVVNIDNGYGAGYMATQINRIGEKTNG